MENQGRVRGLLWGAGLLVAGLAAWVWASARPIPFSAMAWADRAKLGELLWTVTGNPEAYEAGMTQTVRQVFDRYARPAQAELDGLRQVGRGMDDLHRLFWQDALQAVATGRPVKNSERRRLEQRLIVQGFLAPLRIQANEDFMKRLAAREPIMTNHGVEMVMDDVTIRRVLDSRDERETAAVLARLLAD